MAFVAVLDANGGVLYSSYYGGTGSDRAHGVAVAGPTVYIAGTAGSFDLPGVSGGYQPTRMNGNDGFVAAFRPDLAGAASLVGATYLGGDAQDLVYGVDADGVSVAVTGLTTSTDFPTANAFRTSRSGSNDAFVAVLNGALTGLDYGSYVGGSSQENFASTHIPCNVRLHAGRVWATGDTTSADFPVTANAVQGTLAGVRDAFVVQIDPNAIGASLVYGTFLGGSGGDAGQDLVVDAAGNVFLAGVARSLDLPVVHAIQVPVTLSVSTAWVAVIGADGGPLRFSTVLGLGGDASGIDLGPEGSVYVTGTTSTFPVTAGAFQTSTAGGGDVWVARIALPLATSANYGAGTPGTLGIPAFAASAPPVLGTAITLDCVSSTPPPGIGILVVGFNQLNVPIFGGTLLAEPVVTAALLFGVGGASFPLVIPNDNSFCGASLFAQVLQFDAGAAAGFSFTRGLALTLGI
jgi:hypothetical protein